MSPTKLGPEIDCATETRSNRKRQTRPLIKESAPRDQTLNYLIVIKIWSQAPDGCFIPRQTGRLTIGRNIRLRLFAFILMTLEVIIVNSVGEIKDTKKIYDCIDTGGYVSKLRKILGPTFHIL
jgi:hypothetical protein